MSHWSCTLSPISMCPPRGTSGVRSCFSFQTVPSWRKASCWPDALRKIRQIRQNAFAGAIGKLQNVRILFVFRNPIDTAPGSTLWQKGLQSTKARSAWQHPIAATPLPHYRTTALPLPHYPATTLSLPHLAHVLFLVQVLFLPIYTSFYSA